MSHSLKRPEFSPKTQSLESRRGHDRMSQFQTNIITWNTWYIVSGDETWVYEFDMQIIQQALLWRVLTRNRKNHAKIIQKSTSWWLFSLTIAVLCTRNSCRKVNYLMRFAVFKRANSTKSWQWWAIIVNDFWLNTQQILSSNHILSRYDITSYGSSQLLSFS
jgi:hypothetical protein